MKLVSVASCKIPHIPSGAKPRDFNWNSIYASPLLVHCKIKYNKTKV